MLFDLEAEGWERLSPTSWRRPDGRIHDFPPGDVQGFVMLLPELWEKVQYIIERIDQMAGELQDLQNDVAALLPAVQSAITLIQTETAKIVQLVTTPGGIDPAAVETSAKQIASVTDALNSAVSAANTALNPPAAPASPAAAPASPAAPAAPPASPAAPASPSTTG